MVKKTICNSKKQLTTNRFNAKRKTKKQNSKQNISTSSFNVTLPDGNYLDSFDHFIGDDKRVLRSKKVLKKNIRASFNRDSSIDSSDNNSTIPEISSRPSTKSRRVIRSPVVEKQNKDKVGGLKRPAILAITDSSSAISQTENIIESRKRSIKTYKKKSNNQNKEPKVRIPLEALHLSHTDASWNVDFSSVATKKSVQALDPVTEASFSHLITSTPAAKNIKSIRNEGENEANVSNILQTTSTQLLTPQKVDNCDIQNKSKEAVQVSNKLSLNDFSEIDAKQKSLMSATERNQSVIVCCDKSLSIINSPQPLKDNKTPNINSIKDQNDSVHVVLSENKESITEQNEASAPKITFRKRLYGQKVKFDAVPEKNVRKTLRGQRITFGDVPKKNVGFTKVCDVHELTDRTIELSHNASQKLFIKSGKWRRTIYDIRKSKLASPRKTLEGFARISVAPENLPNFVSQRRKSIYVKDIPKRRTLLPSNLNKVDFVLDESDAESNCLSDFSPKQTPFNDISKSRASRSLHSIDSTDSQQYSDFLGFNSLTFDDSVDEINDLALKLNLEYSHEELKEQLLKRCGQTEVLHFDEIYSSSVLKKCRKIGEGVFGEVFLNESPKASYVLKIVPIEGVEPINGAVQKKFVEILQEVIISQELSSLRNDKENQTAGFVEVLNVRLVEGRYPDHLLNLWEDYKDRRGTENDKPDIFNDDQLYIVFELANGGLDLEAFLFKNADQSFSVFKQVAISLAVAENKFQFEHRDLHWGNVLIVPTNEKIITFYLNGKPIEVHAHGVKATIIDYTLSRIVYKDCCLYQDLAADPELFEACGDYQYDIYRLMNKQTNGCWELFVPYTNILWLHYTVDKMIDGARYSSKKNVKHRRMIDVLMKVRDEILEYKSVLEYTESLY